MDESAPTLAELEKQMVLDRDKIQSIIDGFIVAYHNGLTKDHSTMIPSYVSRLPTGAETGTYLSLDLGGTNLRVAAVTLLGEGKADVEQKQFVIPAELKIGPVENLLDWVATGVKELLDFLGIQVDSISEKGLFMGIEGQNIVDLLHAAFKRKGMNIHIAAIVNDCVGTFVANAYKDQNTIVSIILGTGTNASCICQTSSISKCKFPKDSPEYMIVNTEWSLMGMDFLPRTKYDKILDLQNFPAVEREIRVAVDGSLYHRFHKYSGWMNKTLRDIQRIKEDKRTKIIPIEDGGCIGAAITAM
ncbi:9001_t:CDS:2, partial [Racocetra fulgida]